MTISPFSPGSLTRSSGDLFVSMRRDLADLQRQLVTGKRADTYGGLGFGRRTSLDARAKLSAIEGYTSAIGNADLRIKLMVQGLARIGKLGSEMKSDTTLTKFELLSDGRTFGQQNAEVRLKEAIDLLNMEVSGRYLFSGRSTETMPVESYDRIMNGDGTRDGLKQLIADRKAADLGADSRGRLTFTHAAGTTSVGLAESAIAGVRDNFGFSIDGAQSIPDAGRIISTLADGGSGASVTLDVAAQPLEGDVVRVTLGLKDGSTATVELKATADADASSTTAFKIGATRQETASALAGALDRALQAKAKGTLAASSATIAAKDFFAGSPSSEPRRIDAGPDGTLATAEGFAAPSGNTLIWYKCDEVPGSPRTGAPVRVDTEQTVGTGAQANEPALQNVLAQFAALAAETFTSADGARYAALAENTFENLADQPGNPKVSDIASELANASSVMTAAKERHGATKNMLLDAIDGVEAASQEEASLAILDLQTRLQASYQTTSILSQLSLVRYL
jgi:flagellar hook-associated protein 3 FlgL